jgi:hypothetical protein
VRSTNIQNITKTRCPLWTSSLWMLIHAFRWIKRVRALGYWHSSGLNPWTVIKHDSTAGVGWENQVLEHWLMGTWTMDTNTVNFLASPIWDNSERINVYLSQLCSSLSGGVESTPKKKEQRRIQIHFWDFSTPPITYSWTVSLILDHTYLVGKLTRTKIADTKVSGIWRF